MRTASLKGLLIAFLTIAPLSASAQTQPAVTSLDRLVKLRDGSMFRGELVEEIPSDHLTLKLATGQIRRIEWADLAEVTPLSASPPPPPPPAPPPPGWMPPQGPGQLAPQGPVVEIISNDARAGLYRLGATGYLSVGTRSGIIELWQPVCNAPCGQPVDREGFYEIRGSGIVPSRSFNLPASGNIRIDVKAGHAGPRIAGLMMVGLGLGAAVGGITLVALSATFKPAFSDPFFATSNQMEAQSAHDMGIGGGVMIGLGVPLAIGGIVLMVSSRTRVTIQGEQLVLKLPGTRLALSGTGLRF